VSRLAEGAHGWPGAKLEAHSFRAAS
jgi:hypothetical protein